MTVETQLIDVNAAPPISEIAFGKIMVSQRKGGAMIRDKYERMNATWPSELPALTEQEAISAVKRLRRFSGLPAFKGKYVATTGNRNTWSHSGEFRVNWTAGWKELVHDMSHYANRRLNPSHAPHAPSHLQLERAMVAYVIEQGWLNGALRRHEKPKPDMRAIKRARVLAGIARWEAKERRAKNALKKLRRQAAYYETRLCTLQNVPIRLDSNSLTRNPTDGPDN